MKYYKFNENDVKAWVDYVRQRSAKTKDNEETNNPSSTGVNSLKNIVEMKLPAASSGVSYLTNMSSLWDFEICKCFCSCSFVPMGLCMCKVLQDFAASGK